VSFLFNGFDTLIRTAVVGVVAYVALVAMLRVSGKRTLSKMNAFDLVVTVAIGSTLATILLSRDVALAEGLLAFAVLIGLQLVVTVAMRCSSTVTRIVKPQPAALVYRGRLLQEALARERVLRVEVEAALRDHGHASIEEVDLVVLETDGTLTVVPRLPDHETDAVRNVRGVRRA